MSTDTDMIVNAIKTLIDSTPPNSNERAEMKQGITKIVELSNKGYMGIYDKSSKTIKFVNNKGEYHDYELHIPARN